MSIILLVEDNSMNREMMVRRLIWEGYELITADNGEQGVKLALSAQPDLILMDMNMPVLDGWQATRRLKSSLDAHHIPVIALTAHAMSEERERCFAAGCDEYEVKPIEFNRLLAKIRLLLNRSITPA